MPALSLFAVSLASDSPVLWTRWGDGQSEGLCTSVAIGGDFDHDGHPDVIAGAPPASVLILSGVDGALLRAFAGSGDSQAFGHAVSDAGDLDADGTPDVLAGDPEAGRVFALSGADGAELLRLQGPRGYGTSVAGVGDMTGDSVPDFVVGSPEESLAVLLTRGVSPDAEIRQRFERLAPVLDKRTLRLFAAADAEAIGHGGVSRLCRITGLARSTVIRGQREISRPAGVSTGRVRRPGAGRKRTCDRDPTLVKDLERLVEPLSRGDPMSPLRWTCKSIRRLRLPRPSDLEKRGQKIFLSGFRLSPE